jgi:hypothetical protein
MSNTATENVNEKAKKAALRKQKKKEGRAKRKAKLSTDKEYAKAFFEAKSKRSAERKAAFRKKKKGK